MKLQVIIILILLLTGIYPAFSADLDSLANEGYKVVDKTSVVGDFEGCLASAPLRFTNGKAFACTTFSYSFAEYMPQVYILKNDKNDIKILVNGKAYSGTLIEQGK